MIIREATPKDVPAIARVHVDSWRTTYRGLVPDSYLASLKYEDRQAMWQRAFNNPNYRGFLYVAEAESEEIVGFVSGGPSRSEDDQGYAGELYAIYVLEAYQGQGIGRQLVETLVTRMAGAGIHSMLLWVLKDNPAEKFYRALGGQKLKTQQIEMEGLMLDEIAYGWEDTSSMKGNK